VEDEEDTVDSKIARLQVEIGITCSSSNRSSVEEAVVRPLTRTSISPGRPTGPPQNEEWSEMSGQNINGSQALLASLGVKDSRRGREGVLAQLNDDEALHDVSTYDIIAAQKAAIAAVSTARTAMVKAKQSIRGFSGYEDDDQSTVVDGRVRKSVNAGTTTTSPRRPSVITGGGKAMVSPAKDSPQTPQIDPTLMSIGVTKPIIAPRSSFARPTRASFGQQAPTRRSFGQPAANNNNAVVAANTNANAANGNANGSILHAPSQENARRPSAVRGGASRRSYEGGLNALLNINVNNNNSNNNNSNNSGKSPAVGVGSETDQPSERRVGPPPVVKPPPTRPAGSFLRAGGGVGAGAPSSGEGRANSNIRGSFKRDAVPPQRRSITANPPPTGSERPSGPAPLVGAGAVATGAGERIPSFNRGRRLVT
jgi:hypothetical protein